MDGRSFRDRAQYILDLGAQGVWGECEAYEYAYTGPGSSYHPTTGTVTAPAAPVTKVPYTVRITATNLRIRKGPGTNNAIVSVIKPGVYTIVSEATGEGATYWGKLKSGLGSAFQSLLLACALLNACA